MLISEGSAGDTEVKRTGVSARKQWLAAGRDVAASEDIDHIQDLQYGGQKTLDNLQKLDKSVNRSIGRQTAAINKSVPEGQSVCGFRICDRSN